MVQAESCRPALVNRLQKSAQTSPETNTAAASTSPSSLKSSLPQLLRKATREIQECLAYTRTKTSHPEEVGERDCCSSGSIGKTLNHDLTGPFFFSLCTQRLQTISQVAWIPKWRHVSPDACSKLIVQAVPHGGLELRPSLLLHFKGVQAESGEGLELNP